MRGSESVNQLKRDYSDYVDQSAEETKPEKKRKINNLAELVESQSLINEKIRNTFKKDRLQVLDDWKTACTYIDKSILSSRYGEKVAQLIEQTIADADYIEKGALQDVCEAFKRDTKKDSYDLQHMCDFIWHDDEQMKKDVSTTVNSVYGDMQELLSTYNTLPALTIRAIGVTFIILLQILQNKTDPLLSVPAETIEQYLQGFDENTTGPQFNIIGKEVGMNYKFVGRRDVKLAIVKHTLSQIQNIHMVDKSSTSLLVVSGVPGIGKSKLNHETKYILKEACNIEPADKDNQMQVLKEYLKKSVFVLVTYGNTLPFLPEEFSSSTIDQEHALCVRILYFYRKPSADIRDLNKAFGKVRLTMRSTVTYIAKRENAQYVHVGVDEYNKLMENAYNQSDKRDSYLPYQIMCNLILHLKSAMGYCEVSNKVVLVTAMISGTVRDIVGAKYSGSEGLTEMISLKEFELEHVLALLASEISEKLVKQVIANESQVRAISIVGLLPRATEILIAYLKEYPHETGETLINAVGERIKVRYNMNRAPDLVAVESFYAVLRWCILRSPIPKSSPVNGITVSDLTVNDMETNGYLLLEECGEGQYTVNLPYTWMKWYATFLDQVGIDAKYPGVHELDLALTHFVHLTSVNNSRRSVVIMNLRTSSFTLQCMGTNQEAIFKSALLLWWCNV